MDNPTAPPPARRYLLFDRAAYAALLGAWLVHFGYIFTYAVNVPYRDEWGMLGPDGLPAGLSWRWLFAFWNEHRIVATKLQIWLLYQVDGWNLVTHQLINFVFYGALVCLVVHLARRAAPEKYRPVFPLLGVFLLSPLAQENHLMGFQSQFHFVLLFFVGAVLLLFTESLTAPRLGTGLALAVLAVFSFGSGGALVGILLLVFCLWKLSRARAAFAQYTADGRRQAQAEIFQAVVAGTVVIIALGLWLGGFNRGSHGATMPFTAQYWVYFFNLLSAGIGHGGEPFTIVPGLLFLIFALVPVVLCLKPRSNAAPAAWAIAAITLGLFAALAITAAARASFGIEQSKASRYTEFSMLLIPCAVAGWTHLLAERVVWIPRLQAACLLACFLAFWHTWKDLPGYAVQYEVRTSSLECVKSYYAGTGRGNCIGLYPDNMASFLDGARRLNLSFYRELQKPPPP